MMNSRTMYLTIGIVFIIIFSYLLFFYLRFYRYISGVNLSSPPNSTSFSVENSDSDREITYIALGDSLSAGIGSTKKENTIVYRYASHLSENNNVVNTINLAIPGDETEDVINNQLAGAIESKPDYITLLIGANDIHSRVSEKKFRENYKFILDELLNKTNAKITVINIPYLGSNRIVLPPYDFLLDSRTKEFNQIILDLVKNTEQSNRIKLVDIYKPSISAFKQNPGYYSSDLFHPSDEGYLFWSEIINAD